LCRGPARDWAGGFSRTRNTAKVNRQGVALIVGLYAVSLLIFSRL